MNWAHVHLLLNHFPILGILFGILLLTVAIARKSEEVKKISFGIFVLVAVAAVPVYLTGEPAEEVVEHLPGVSESFVERHEDAALVSFVAIEIVGAIALAGLFVSRHLPSVPRAWVLTVLLLALTSGGIVSWTANLGGQIRHTEIRAGTESSTSIGQAGHEEHEEREEESDERDD